MLALRERQKRNLMATLLLSQGVPMIRGGDELGQTQGGNNNAYCQDNEISWLDWDLTPAQRDFLDFTAPGDSPPPDAAGAPPAALLPGAEHPRRGRQGHRLVRPERPGDDRRSLERAARCARWRVRLAGDAIDERDERGQRVVGSTLILLLNAAESEVTFTLPAAPPRSYWEEVIDAANGVHPPAIVYGGARYPLTGRSLAVLVLRREKRRHQLNEPTRPGEATPADASPERPAAAAASGDARQGKHDELVRPAR